ncbi:acyl-CoA carboxylase subunit beta [Singulisphaera acidiphila]|uniref:Acetyl-CoA carboxylase, carboxyltransferase component (Subunits alpha and beta) n=1 Tax=Singulisphaera acidiphila (strain ATCC BAA-1392 / DSM 18658 / VKM B-2454 / MOB10) TaxID=886293 RepID=L0DLF5_SINAD|nr:acyl-CoA carboxylase subunit beta [Singulisphaera acidiphila]AGA30224.1 acetyl-CoA carboxylase, carboxyltransferase component (subunits alpha and beta) [Singulisphaera acidiphila DSM 18658]
MPTAESGTDHRRPVEPDLREVTARLLAEAERIREGGGAEAIARQHAKGRKTARERIAALTDVDSSFLELGLWAGYQLYEEWGGAPGAGVITGVGQVADRRVMIIANDATVKAGAFFPMTIKKVLRAQTIAARNRLPLIYLVDSSGVFLPMQDEVFPDDDDFGRIFRNNAVLSAQGVPQFAAIMGNCVAGGAYLPVLCDTVLMTEGSGLYLAGPALVKAAIGQDITHEELGGAGMHAAISGTVDYHEPDDDSCLARLRRLVSLLPPDPKGAAESVPVDPPARSADDLFSIVRTDSSAQYDVRDLLAALVDGGRFDEYRADYGKSLFCGFARLGGIPVGIVANQRLRFRPEGGGPYQFGGVIYADSADKAARFVLDCNQARIPLLFIQDVNGFDVGRDAERSGIIRRGAKLVNAVSNSVVPKLTLIVGHSFGAGHYALCGKAFDPHFLFAWPGARYAVMGAQQAARTMLDVQVATLKRQGKQVDDRELNAIADDLRARYDRETDIRYAAARGWVDAIIDPLKTREVLALALDLATRQRETVGFPVGVFQV